MVLCRKRYIASLSLSYFTYDTCVMLFQIIQPYEDCYYVFDATNMCKHISGRWTVEVSNRLWT
jgi:hypothetical protein